MNSLWLVIGVTVAVIGLLTALFLHKVRLKKKIKSLHWETKQEREDRRLRIWTYIFGVATILGVVCALLAWFLPFRAKLEKETEQRILRIEKEAKEAKKEAKEANENIKLIEKNLGIPIYVDGLPEADPPVFDPFAKGVKLMIVYSWDEAIAEFKQSMKQAKASQLVSLYFLVALCYFQLDRNDLAHENLNKSLSSAREFNDREGEAQVLLALAGVYQLVEHNSDTALTCAQNALEIFREIGSKEGEANALELLSGLFMTEDDFHKALECGKHALKIFKQIGSKGGMALGLKTLGFIFLQSGDFDKAEEYLKGALKIYQEIDSKEGKIAALGSLAMIYEDKGDSIKCREYRSEAVRISIQIVEEYQLKSAKELGNKRGEAIAVALLINLHYMIGDLDGALKYCQEALTLAKELCDKKSEATCLTYLGVIFENKGEKEKALIYYEKASEIFTQIGVQNEMEEIKEEFKILRDE
jgi:tetratricopeptide (TPR) repeat protein